MKKLARRELLLPEMLPTLTDSETHGKQRFARSHRFESAIQEFTKRQKIADSCSASDGFDRDLNSTQSTEPGTTSSTGRTGSATLSTPSPTESSTSSSSSQSDSVPPVQSASHGAPEPVGQIPFQRAFPTMPVARTEGFIEDFRRLSAQQKNSELTRILDYATLPVDAEERMAVMNIRESALCAIYSIFTLEQRTTELRKIGDRATLPDNRDDRSEEMCMRASRLRALLACMPETEREAELANAKNWATLPTDPEQLSDELSIREVRITTCIDAGTRDYLQREHDRAVTVSTLPENPTELVNALKLRQLMFNALYEHLPAEEFRDWVDKMIGEPIPTCSKGVALRELHMRCLRSNVDPEYLASSLDDFMHYSLLAHGDELEADLQLLHVNLVSIYHNIPRERAVAALREAQDPETWLHQIKLEDRNMSDWIRSRAERMNEVIQDALKQVLDL